MYDRSVADMPQAWLEAAARVDSFGKIDRDNAEQMEARAALLHATPDILCRGDVAAVSPEIHISRTSPPKQTPQSCCAAGRVRGAALQLPRDRLLARGVRVPARDAPIHAQPEGLRVAPRAPRRGVQGAAAAAAGAAMSRRACVCLRAFVRLQAGALPREATVRACAAVHCSLVKHS
jgi:hypothetical protein